MLKDHESKVAHIKSFVFSCFVAHSKRHYPANSPTGGDHHPCHDNKYIGGMRVLVIECTSACPHVYA